MPRITKKDCMDVHDEMWKLYKAGRFGGQNIPIVYCYHTWKLERLKAARKINLKAIETLLKFEEST